GDYQVTGGLVNGSAYTRFNVYVSGEQTFDAGSRQLQALLMNIDTGTAPVKLTLDGSILLDTNGSQLNINSNIPVDIAGTVEFGPNSANSTSSFTNNGTITIKDGAVLDLRNAG